MILFILSGAPDKRLNHRMETAPPLIGNSTALPSLEDLPNLDIYQREILLARLTALRTRRLRQHVKAATALEDISDWIEAKCYDADKCLNPEHPQGNTPLIRLTSVQKRIFRKCFTIDPRTGRFPYRTVVISKPKKGGKSAEGGMIGSYFAAQVEAPNAVYCLANDREQSSGRVFKSMRPTLFGLGGRKDGKYKIILPNGSYVQASTSEPEKEAGASYGLTIWDELWGYKSERATLLWDELRPIGTRTNSMRLVVTYAGFTDSSDLLLKLYSRIFKDTNEANLAEGRLPDGTLWQARAVEELKDITTRVLPENADRVIPCCYEVPEIGLFYYNDHEQRMPWTLGEAGEALIRETAATETEANTYRLTYNRWQITESRFLDDDTLYDAIEKPEAPIRRNIPMTFAIDASMRHDSTALAGAYDEMINGSYAYRTGYARAWNPRGENIDLEETVIAELLRLFRAGLVRKRQAQAGELKIIAAENLTPIDVWYDPFQMHQVAMNLRKRHKLLIAEFTQLKERTLADSFLYRQYKTRNICIIDDPVLKSHLESAKAESQDAEGQDAEKAELEKLRIVKAQGINAKPIDLAVAQSMSVFKCSKRIRSAGLAGLAQGKAKGWQK